MNKKTPLVSIIVPAFRTEGYIKAFIDSLKTTRYLNYEVVVVYDPSPDRGLEIARKMVKGLSNWRLVENQERLGSTKCLNLGLSLAQGELIAFLSCDITVDPDWLDNLVRYLINSDKKVGATIAKFNDFHQHNLVQVYRLFLLPQTGWVVSPDLGQSDGSLYQQPREGFNGFEGLVVRKEVFDVVGGFDEDVDALIYDLDMSWRVWLAGYRIVTVPSAVVYHWSLKEGRQNAKWEFFYSRMINLFIKNYSLKYLAWFLPQALAVYTLRAILLLFLGKPDALKGWLEALKWTVVHLPQTLQKRRHIQNNIRKVSDEYLFSKIFYPGSLWSFYKYLRKTRSEIAPILLSEQSKEKKYLTHSA